MRTTLLLIGIYFKAWLATAQDPEQSRLLTPNYQPQSLEQALTTLTATNIIVARMLVEYKAGQAVILQPGFEARAGSVFTAHTGTALQITDNASTSLALGTYPNPFEQITTITYVLTKPGHTSLYIADAEGKRINQLVDDQYQEAGRHWVQWQGALVPTGTYVCVLESGLKRLSKRIIRK